MLNLARKLKNFIFTDDNVNDENDEFDTQEEIKNDTKIFSDYQSGTANVSENDKTIIREPLRKKEVRLRVLTQNGIEKEIVIDSVETNIGRQKSNEIVLNDKSVSRVHAQLINKKYYYKIRDLSSTNGSYVNGKAIKEQKLVDGDKIKLGKTTLEFSLDG
ncbi:FHA domain-containing protein [Halanaerobacter jeridensis]|uniref:FHA domain-containing protein n=1 Tax=Halanaerobacter jeridensis TaxID=706427 RepID=UPI0019580D88